MTRPSWNQPLCWPCWNTETGNQVPRTVVDPWPETCCMCGQVTNSGIFVRRDPGTVYWPREAKWDEDV